MELASLFATSSGTAAAASAAGSTIGPVTAAASGASAIGSTLSSLSTLTTGLTLASMASDIFGGVTAGKSIAEQLEQQAEQDLLNARQEELAGQQERNDISENLRQTIASQRLAYSAGGVDYSFGTGEALEKNLRRRAELQLGTSRDNTRLKTLARRREAYIKRSQISQAQFAPVLAGVSSAGKTLAARAS